MPPRLKMARANGAVWVLALTALLPPAALSQQAGDYVGTTSQGLPIVVTVSPHEFGQLEISLIDFEWDVLCPSGQRQSYGVSGAPFPTVMAGSEPVRWESRSFDIFFGLEFRFTGDGTQLSGLLLGNSPALVRPRPGRSPAQLCSSGQVAFEASLAPIEAADTGARARTRHSAPTTRPRVVIPARQLQRVTP